MSNELCVPWEPLPGLTAPCGSISFSYEPPDRLRARLGFSEVVGGIPQDLLLTFSGVIAARFESESFGIVPLPSQLPKLSAPQWLNWTFPLLQVSSSSWLEEHASHNPAAAERRVHFALISLNDLLHILAMPEVIAEWCVQARMTPNPSLHPTCVSRLRRLPQAGELQRQAPVELVLRSAEASDATRVADILIGTRRAFMPYAPSTHSEPEVRHWVASCLLPSAGVTVAESNGQVVAIMATERGERCSWVTQMAVDPKLLNRGIGSLLLAHAMRTLPPLIRLYTFQANVGARRFYERHGFIATEFTDGQANEERCPDVLYEWQVASAVA